METARNKRRQTLIISLLYLIALTLLGSCHKHEQAPNKSESEMHSTIDNAPQNDYVATKYTFQSKEGKVYPIYLTKEGSAFIFKDSIGQAQYRKYLPDVTTDIAKMARGDRDLIN